jgi:hypothetical protein
MLQGGLLTSQAETRITKLGTSNTQHFTGLVPDVNTNTQLETNIKIETNTQLETNVQLQTLLNGWLNPDSVGPPPPKESGGKRQYSQYTRNAACIYCHTMKIRCHGRDEGAESCIACSRKGLVNIEYCLSMANIYSW